MTGERTDGTRGEHPRIRRAVARGLRRRCPHCGEGALFERWFTLHRSCSACGLRFERHPGDNWAFWVFGDRVFLGALLLTLVLLAGRLTWGFGLALLAVTCAALVVTMPHRLGACVALDYLARRWSGEAVPGAAAQEPPP
jgi:uncharacterized protein (DUF983 family)